MAKIATTYGKKRTSARQLDERRYRRSLLASFSSSEPDTAQSVLNPHPSSIQYDSTPITSIKETVPMHTLSTANPPALGYLQRSTVPRLLPIASPSRPLLSTPNKRIDPFKDSRTEKPPVALGQSPPLAHPVQAAHASTHCSPASYTVTARDDSTPEVLKIVNPADIDDKITAMLAATASLKPRAPPTAPRLSTNACRTPSSAIGHQSAEAVGILQKIKKSQQLLVGDGTPESQKRSLSQAEESVLISEQLTTIELRLNEGNNLNRRKVQKIVGGSIKRKPVHCQSRPMRQNLLDDCRGSHGPVDCRPSSPQAGSSTYPRDPFEAETSFDENLSDGMLSETPAGSSTPKSTSLTPRLYRIDEDDDSVSLNSKLGLDTLHVNDPNINPDIFAPEMGATAVESVAGEHRVKKHPSPSKKALEDLEVAFAMYTRLKPLGCGDGTDELAKDCRGALSVTDRNRPIRQSRSKCTAPAVAPHLAHRGAHRIRYSLPYRPALAGSQDIDELRD